MTHFDYSLKIATLMYGGMFLWIFLCVFVIRHTSPLLILFFVVTLLMLPYVPNIINKILINVTTGVTSIWVVIIAWLTVT